MTKFVNLDGVYVNPHHVVSVSARLNGNFVSADVYLLGGTSIFYCEEENGNAQEIVATVVALIEAALNDPGTPPPYEASQREPHLMCAQCAYYQSLEQTCSHPANQLANGDPCFMEPHKFCGHFTHPT